MLDGQAQDAQDAQEPKDMDLKPSLKPHETQRNPHGFGTDPIKFFVSSPLPNSPKFLIAPGFGASARGCATSALRYAICNALVLAA